MSDHPTTRGRERSERRDALLGAGQRDLARPPSPARLPLPPVPVAARPGAGPASRPAPTGRPAPLPERRIDVAVPVRGADALGPVPGGDALFPKPVHAAAKAAVPGLAPQGAWPEDEPLVTTGPGLSRGARPPLVPRVPRQTTPSGAPASSYGDWTKPSKADESARGIAGPSSPQVPIAPGTTAIPERKVAARSAAADHLDDDDDDAYGAGADAGHDEDHDAAPGYDADLDRPAPVAGPGTGPSKTGRATYRAERQAADSARRKAAKRNGEPDVLFDDEEDHKPHLVLKSLVAMVVVALAVLGVYTVGKPQPTQPVAQTAAPETEAPVVAPPTAELPPLANEPITLVPETTATVRAPVTVLNATDVNGLAGKISAAVVAGGWESAATGAYPGTDVATTTVFYTDGDDQQRQAAEQLVGQFPDLAGPAPRFFDVSGVAAPGLVIVATGNWQP